MAAKYDFPPIIKGDTFNGKTISLLVNDEPMDLTGAKAIMQIKPSHKSRATHTFDISIVDEVGGILKIERWDVDAQPHNYLYDLKITLNNGITLTYMAGMFPIKPNVSKW